MELIKVTEENGEQLVSARDLHKFLEITERFNNWFERQLQYGFEENVDFTGCKFFNTLANQELQDYILKLDMATMHIVTGPIHFIDAVTGWDLMANLKHAAEGAKDMLKIFYDGISKVKDSIKNVLGGERQKKMLRVADNLEYNMPDPK